MRHPSNKCHVVTDVVARKTVLQQRSKCFQCLRISHFARNCTTNSRCYICEGDHHISICERKCKSPKGEEENSYTSLLVNNYRGHTLLQIAEAEIFSTEQDKNHTRGRILFDNVGEDVRQRLKLRSCRKERIMVKTFGSTEHELKQLDVVLVQIQGISSKYLNHIEALVVPTICSPLTNQVIDLARNSY